jgi:hypothetical protein
LLLAFSFREKPSVCVGRSGSHGCLQETGKLPEERLGWRKTLQECLAVHVEQAIPKPGTQRDLKPGKGRVGALQ